MNRLLFLVLLMPSLAFSECAEEQLSAPISVDVVKELESEGYPVDHGPMLEVTITAPSQVKGVPIAGMELSRGEVAEFFIPLAFSNKDGAAVAYFMGYKESLFGFELSVYYQSESCILYTQRAI